jgi:hypothetical protein
MEESGRLRPRIGEERTGRVVGGGRRRVVVEAGGAYVFGLGLGLGLGIWGCWGGLHDRP